MKFELQLLLSYSLNPEDWKIYTPVHLHNSSSAQPPYVLIVSAWHVKIISGY